MNENKYDAIPLADLLSQCAQTGSVDLPGSWTQGRTAFGGLSTALAYTAAEQLEQGLPNLRSAQIAFTGPLFGQLKTEAKMLRRGRSTAFIQSEVFGEKGLGLHCNFVFAARRETQITAYQMEAPEFPALPTSEDLHSGPPAFFTSNMEYVGKRIDINVKTQRLTRWMRLKHRESLDPMAELLCMGDSLPPSIMGLLNQNAMVSSMNWQINIIADHISTKDGWWLIDSATHHANHGASSQYMSIWNSDRELIATAMQSVAYYA